MLQAAPFDTSIAKQKSEQFEALAQEPNAHLERLTSRLARQILDGKEGLGIEFKLEKRFARIAEMLFSHRDCSAATRQPGGPYWGYPET